MTALDRLTGRERALIAIALPLILIALAWRFAWMPLDAARQAAQAEIAAYRGIIAAAATADAPAIAPPADPRPLATCVTATAEAAGLVLRRLEPEGDRLRLTVDAAPFAVLMDWIAALEERDGARVVAVEIDRRIEPGTVSARILLEDAG